MIKNRLRIQYTGIRWLIYILAITGAVTILSGQSVMLSDDNGFDLSSTLIPRHQIHHGGPPKDGIPAIDEPVIIKAGEVTFLGPDDRILGLNHDGITRAYPIKILNYHEIVNDRINDRNILITYCPLCGSGMAFMPAHGHTDKTFGVSGLLYNSDMLLYDRETQSLWSQIMSQAISGTMKGTHLHGLALTDTTWRQWLRQHPETQVLSTNTGYIRNYDSHPYGDYENKTSLYFPVNNRSTRYHPKQRVTGIIINNKAKAYPFSELSKQGSPEFTDEFAGKTITIHYDDASQSAVIYDANNRLLTSTTLFWFAWYGFYPDTEVFTYSEK